MIEEKDLIKRVEELEHYQSLIMGKDIGMSGVWSRFSNLSDKIYRLEKRMEEQETHTKYGTIEQVLENIDKMKKTWDENIESFLKQVDNKLDTRDKQISDLEKKTSEGGSLYNLALEADANTNRLDKEIEKLKNK